MAKKKSNARTRRKRRLQRWRNALALIALLLAAATVFSGFRAFGGEAEATEAEETTAATAEETTDDTGDSTFAATEGTEEPTEGSTAPTGPAPEYVGTEEKANVLKNGFSIYSEPNETGKGLSERVRTETVTLYPHTCFTDENSNIWMLVKAEDKETSETVFGWALVGEEYVQLKTDAAGNTIIEEDELVLYDEDGEKKVTVYESCLVDTQNIDTDSNEGFNERKVAVKWEENTYYAKIRKEYVALKQDKLWESFTPPEYNAIVSAVSGASYYSKSDEGIYTEVGSSADYATQVSVVRITKDEDGILWAELFDDGGTVWTQKDNLSMNEETIRRQGNTTSGDKEHNAKVVNADLGLKERVDPKWGSQETGTTYKIGDTLWVDWESQTTEETKGTSRTWLRTHDGYVLWKERDTATGKESEFLEKISGLNMTADTLSASAEGSGTVLDTLQEGESTAEASPDAIDNSYRGLAENAPEEEPTTNYWKIVFFVCAGLLAADLIAVVVLTMQIEKIQDSAETGGGGQVVPPPASYPTVGYLSNQGKRPSQQDSFCVAKTFGGTGILAAVADGMGGLSGGDQVSGRIVKDVQEFAPRIQPQDMDTVLPNLVNLLSDDINKMLGPDGIYKSGSTLLLVLTDGKRFSWASVGDSRICLYRAGVLNHVNPEHNQFTTEWMPKVQRGEMTLQQAHSDPANGRKLTSFIGMGKLRYVSRSQTSAALMPGDRIILMSDGVFNTLSDAKLAQLLGQYTDVQEAARQIKQSVLAADARGQDNFTAVILGF